MTRDQALILFPAVLIVAAGVVFGPDAAAAATGVVAYSAALAFLSVLVVAYSVRFIQGAVFEVHVGMWIRRLSKYAAHGDFIGGVTFDWNGIRYEVRQTLPSGDDK